MDRDLLHHGIVLLQLKTIRGVFTILLRNIPGGTRKTRLLVLSALQNDLDSIAFTFLCHDGNALNLKLNTHVETLAGTHLQVQVDTVFVDVAQRGGRHL